MVVGWLGENLRIDIPTVETDLHGQVAVEIGFLQGFHHGRN